MKFIHQQIFEALTDGQLMGLCIEREAGGEPYEGKVAVGTIILNRVDARNWDGKTIKEVILKPWQFSWTMQEAGTEYYDESVKIASHWEDEYNKRKTLQQGCEIARKMIDGEIPRDPDLVRCYQYLNPKVAKAARVRWLKAGMEIIKVINNHEFYRTKED